MKKHYETHVEDTDKLISVAGPVLDYKSWYEQYRKLMEEQAQRKHGLYTPTSEGDDDDFPSIPGMVARYSALGLTNEQMAENPVWKDLMGNGYDLQMMNFAWSGMSGVGGYEMNFNLWTNNVPSVPDISMSTTTTSVSVSVGNSTYNNNLIYIHINNWDINKNHWLKVTSTYEDGDLAFVFYNNSNTKKIGLPANGYVNILAYPEFKGSYMYISTTSNKQGSFTIEQLPLYPGALVFDGVDDYGVCNNFPILNKEKGYTVVALRQWISMSKGISGLVSNVKNWFNDGAFVLEYNSNNATNKFVNRPVSFGNVNIEMDLPNNFTYQTSKSYKGVPITTGSFKGTNSFFVGKLNNIIGDCSNIAIWELVFLDHDATEEELAKIKDYFVKTYPWLFPDQAWTVTGKTNEDEDRATIANITGNGNDLVLLNFGFAEGSGYGLYVVDFKSIFHQTSDAITLKNHSFEYRFNETGTGDIFYILSESVAPGAEYKKIPPFVINVVSGTAEFYYYQYLNSKGNLVLLQLKNGRNELPKSYAGIANSGGKIGFLVKKTDPEVNISNLYVEQIPEYEGYLVTDGVDDKVQSSSFTMNEDWTIVGDWELLSNVQINCGIVKAQNVYLYNTANGLLISINNPRSLQSFGTKSLHAICSDGRLYDRNWVEYEYTADQNFEIVKSGLNIGFNLNNYAQIAFKNLGIYNNQILSKDDCIKAYNYLQTLKSK